MCTYWFFLNCYSFVNNLKTLKQDNSWSRIRILKFKEVSNPNYADNNWTSANGNIDSQHYFSNNCGATRIEENSTTKQLLKVTDLLGRETKQTNQPLFYIYDDGTVEKRITIDWQ